MTKPIATTNTGVSPNRAAHLTHVVVSSMWPGIPKKIRAISSHPMIWATKAARRNQAIHPLLHQKLSRALYNPEKNALAGTGPSLNASSAPSSNMGDVVLDPFCGCGTAVAAAQKLNRQWLHRHHPSRRRPHEEHQDRLQPGRRRRLPGRRRAEDVDCSAQRPGRSRTASVASSGPVEIFLEPSQREEGKKGAECGIDGVRSAQGRRPGQKSGKVSRDTAATSRAVSASRLCPGPLHHSACAPRPSPPASTTPTSGSATTPSSRSAPSPTSSPTTPSRSRDTPPCTRRPARPATEGRQAAFNHPTAPGA